MELTPKTTLVFITVSCFLLLGAQGAPTKGRYMKVSCKPDAKNANCNVIKGPLIDIPNSREKFKFSQDPMEESSGDGSGDSQSFTGTGGQPAAERQVLSVLSPAEGSTELDEGSAMGNDSSIFIFPEKELKKNLPAEKELKEEGFIL
ncbi:serglycin [Paramormyrops kingsleyae]|uniref:serglycin n=1 Tax=Paramormyrops kingsleyae TaxID=1676925 RepID=UPI003B97511B